LVLQDFDGMTSDELSLHKNDFLIVTNWNIKDGLAAGYKINNLQKKGNFPSTVVVRKYFNEGMFII